MRQSVVVGGGLLLLLFVYAARHGETPVTPRSLATTAPVSTGDTQPLLFFDKDLFYEGVLYAKQHSESFQMPVAGAIIPHHLVASYIIADFFHRLAPQKPSTIILIGPNHPEAGKNKVVSSSLGWETPFGVVAPNQEIMHDLLEKHVTTVDNTLAANEHSVGGIMPYLKYYLPDTTVVPIILKRGMSLEEVRSLARSLKDYSNTGAVIVASVDFSHYLSSQETQQKDDVTLKALQAFDYTSLLTFMSDYADSPPSLAVLLATMQQNGTTKNDVLQHTNSGILQHNPFQSTTSYFSIVFY